MRSTTSCGVGTYGTVDSAAGAAAAASMPASSTIVARIRRFKVSGETFRTPQYEIRCTTHPPLSDRTKRQYGCVALIGFLRQRHSFRDFPGVTTRLGHSTLVDCAFTRGGKLYPI